MAADGSDWIVWAAPSPSATALQTALAAAQSGAGRLAPAADAEAAAAALAGRDDLRLCLLYSAPEAHLAATLRAGGDIDAALADWLGGAKAALALQRRHRARSVLFEAGHLRRYADVGLSRLGLAPGAAPLAAAPAPPHDPMLEMIAHHYVRQRPEVLAAVDALEASAQILSNDGRIDTLPGAGSVLQTWRAETARQQEAETGRAAAEERLRGLEDRLQQLQAERDAEAGAAAELRAALAAETQRRTEGAEAFETYRAAQERRMALAMRVQTCLSQERAAILGEMEDLERRFGEIERVLHYKTADLEEFRARSAALEEDRRAARAELDRAGAREAALAAEIERIMNSRSMRLTGPMRRLAALLRRRA